MLNPLDSTKNEGGGALTKNGVEQSFLDHSGQSWSVNTGNRLLYKAVIDFFSTKPLDFSETAPLPRAHSFLWEFAPKLWMAVETHFFTMFKNQMYSPRETYSLKIYTSRFLISDCSCFLKKCLISLGFLLPEKGTTPLYSGKSLATIQLIIIGEKPRRKAQRTVILCMFICVFPCVFCQARCSK